MSKSSAARLIVNAALPTTRIGVLDSRLRPVDSSLMPAGEEYAAGALQVDLPRGIYRVVFHEGSAAATREVLLQEDTVTVDQGSSLPFVSPVPIHGTSTTHRWHEDGLQSAWTARKIRVSRSGSADIFVFVREVGQRESNWTWPQSGKEPVLNPAAELRLVDTRGACAYDFAQPSVGGSANRRYAAARFAVQPALWRLRAGPDDGGIELALPMAEGWVTHVYAFARRETPERIRVDLASASVWMTRIEESQLDPEHVWRVRETALASLRANIPLVGARADAALRTGFDDPILGIVGGYLHLIGHTDRAKKTPDTSILVRVVERLTELLGSPSPETLPDVAALRFLATGEVSQTSQPPLFGRSFDTIRVAALTRSEWVKAGSLASTVVPAVLHKNPWLIWSTKLAAWRQEPGGAENTNSPIERGRPLDSMTGHPVPLPPIELLFIALKHLSRESLEHVRRQLPVASPLLDAARPELHSELHRALAELGMALPAPHVGNVGTAVERLGWPATAVAELASAALECATRELRTVEASGSYLYHALDRWTESQTDPTILSQVLEHAISSDLELTKELVAWFSRSDSKFSCAIYSAPRGPKSDEDFFLRVAPLDAESRPSLQRLKVKVFRGLNHLPQKFASLHSYDHLSADDAFQALPQGPRSS